LEKQKKFPKKFIRKNFFLVRKNPIFKKKKNKYIKIQKSSPLQKNE